MIPHQSRYGFILARAKVFARIEWKDTSKNPTQEVKTTPSQNDLDMVRGLRKSGRAREDTNHTLSKKAMNPTGMGF